MHCCLYKPTESEDRNVRVRGAQETATGGRALKFYSSVRIEVRRGKSITRGDSIIGHELWIKVVKNKQAPPFRTAHASLIYGKEFQRQWQSWIWR